jgi:hypothetical protein
MKTYTTSQVIRLLELHPSWVFEAPETEHMHKSKCVHTFAIGSNCVSFSHSWESSVDGRVKTESDGNPYLRNDWTRALRAPKLKRIRRSVGTVTVVGDSVTLTNTTAFLELGDGVYDLEAVKTEVK